MPKPLPKEFLLSRGSCCKNGCKNCPYGYNKNKNMKVAICLIIKNENEYLEEWLNHHRNLGFDHFIIYDNQSTPSVTEYFLNKNLTHSDTTVIYWKDNAHASQLRAYKNCCINNSNYNYIAFIDTDEFIMLNGYSNIKDYLKSISMSFDALVLSWRMYGQPKPYFTNKTPMTDYIYYHEDIHVKSLVNPKKVIEFKNPHNSTITGICIDELGNKVKGAWNIHTSKNIWIKHIWTRSQSEFKIKIERGTGDKVVRERTMQDFINHNDQCKIKDVTYTDNII